MKILLVTILSFLVIGCSPKIEPTVVPSQQLQPEPQNPSEPAKPAKPSPRKPETKRVCIMVWDASMGKEVEKCKTMTVREKHKGEKVPRN